MLLPWSSRALRELTTFSGSIRATSLSGVALYALCVTLCHELLTLPARVYLRQLERRYDRSTSSLGSGLAEHLNGMALLLCVIPTGVVSLYATIQIWPSRWWIIASSGFALFVVGLAKVGPVMLPWVARVMPLVRPDLRQRLERLAARAGVADVGFHQYRLGAMSRRANAALVGFGQSRRILLSDTLVGDYSDDEIEVVVAHELGHHQHADIWKELASDFVMIVVGCYTASRALLNLGPSLGLFGPDDPAGLPLVLLGGGVGVLATAPLANLVSRYHERRADRFALELTRNTGAFISAMWRLGEEHLAERRPSRWLAFLCYTHPPVYERIEAAGNLAAAWGRPLSTRMR